VYIIEILITSVVIVLLTCVIVTLVCATVLLIKSTIDGIKTTPATKMCVSSAESQNNDVIDRVFMDRLYKLRQPYSVKMHQRNVTKDDKNQ